MVHFWEQKKKTLTRKSRNIAQKLHLYMLPRKRTSSNIEYCSRRSEKYEQNGANLRNSKTNKNLSSPGISKVFAL